jgi:TPR repeat protein
VRLLSRMSLRLTAERLRRVPSSDAQELQLAPFLRLLHESALSNDQQLAGAALNLLAESVEVADNPLGLQQDPLLAVELYRAAAERGNPSAQFALASLESQGLFGVEKDEASAVLRQYFAASGGSFEAQMAIGSRYLHGRGVPRRCEAALRYLERAAEWSASHSWPERGTLPPSRFRIDEKLLSEPGKLDEVETARVGFIRNAADKGDTKAAAAMGHIYYQGLLGQPRDVARALQLYEEGAIGDSFDSIAAVGHLYAEGLGSDSGKPALRVAKKLLESAAKEGHASAMATLGVVMLREAGIVPWFNATDALSKSHVPSPQSRFGLISRRSLDLKGANAPPADEKKQDEGSLLSGMRQGSKAVGDDNWAAASSTMQQAVTVDGQEGSEVERLQSFKSDIHRALSLLARAADKGNAEANYNLALLRMRGLSPEEAHGSKGFMRDFSKAAAFAAAAARRGFTPALLLLARMNQYGLGVETSCHNAAQLYTSVVRRGIGSDEMEIARRRLARFDVTGAVFAWSRAALMGFDLAMWNLGFVLDRVRVATHAPILPTHSTGFDLANPVRAVWTVGEAGIATISRALFASSPLGLNEMFESATAVRATLTSPRPLQAILRDALERQPIDPVRLSAQVLLGSSSMGVKDLLVQLEDRALGLFDHAAAAGDAQASLMVGEYVLHGRGHTAGRAEAAEPHIRKAADAQDARALWSLGWMHEMGHGLPTDWFLAKRYYDQSAAVATDSSAPANMALGRLWIKTRLVQWLSPPWVRLLVPYLEPILGPMRFTTPPGEDTPTASVPVAPTQAASSAHRGEPKEEDSIAAIIKRRRARYQSRDTEESLLWKALRSTQSLGEVLGLPSSWTDQLDVLSQGDPEAAILLLLFSALGLVLALIACGVRL